MPLPQGGGADPSSAPPPPQGDGAVSSGGAGPETTGTLPPTGGAGAIDQGIPAQGLMAMGMEIMRKAMGQMHFARALLDPYSEEGKAVDEMFRKGIKHFKPDQEAQKTGKVPNMAQGQGATGGPPQMAPNPQPPTGPIPSLAGANV